MVARLLLVLLVLLSVQGEALVVDRPVLATDDEVTGTTEPGVLVYLRVYRDHPGGYTDATMSDENGRFRFGVDLSDAIGVGVSLESGTVKVWAPVEWRFYLTVVMVVGKVGSGE